MAVAPRTLGGVLHRQVVHRGEHGERPVVRGGRLLQQILLLEQVRLTQEPFEIGRQPLRDECLDRLGAGALREVHAVRVVPVAAFAVLPRHHRVVAELIEPRPDERVAALDLVVQETERQLPVHGLDPERQPAQFDGQRIDVDAVDASFHHVAAEHRLEAGLEIGVVRRAGDQLVADALAVVAGILADAEQPDQGTLAVGFDAAMVLQRGIQRVG